MKNLIKIAFLTISPLFVFSCSTSDDELDTEKPKIILGTPGDHEEFHFGDTIELQALLTDNVELGSYKIDIHTDADGHQHRTISTNWDYSDTGVLEGKKEYILNKTIQIPEGDYKEGHYHLGLMVIDKAGNQTETYIEIVIGEDHHH